MKKLVAAERRYRREPQKKGWLMVDVPKEDRRYIGLVFENFRYSGNTELEFCAYHYVFRSKSCDWNDDAKDRLRKQPLIESVVYITPLKMFRIHVLSMKSLRRETQKTIDAWTMIAIRFNVCKDVRRVISLYLHVSRAKWGVNLLRILMHLENTPSIK